MTPEAAAGQGLFDASAAAEREVRRGALLVLAPVRCTGQTPGEAVVVRETSDSSNRAAVPLPRIPSGPDVTRGDGRSALPQRDRRH